MRTGRAPSGTRPVPRTSVRLTGASASVGGSSGRPAGTDGVGELVWILPVARRTGGAVAPAREGRLAANHLGGLLRFMQVGPPPFSRAPMVRQIPRCGKQRGERR